DVVGAEVALLVRGDDPVVEPHVHHRDVLDVDVVVQVLTGRRRPFELLQPAVGPGRARRAARQVTVDGQLAGGGDPCGVAAAQPVHDVDGVRRLLQEQPGAPPALGVPVLEVVVAAVGHEVADPDGLRLADGPLGDDVAHQAYDAHVPHVV